MASSTTPHLSRIEVLRALRLSNYEAVLATVHASLTTGAFLTGFALMLGANDFWMGVIGAVPTFAALIQLASSLWVERLGRRKGLTAWFSLFSRALWLPILLVPFALPESSRLAGFLLLFALASVAIQVPVPAFTSWLSDLVPADHRGRYFGRRNMLAGLTVMVASIPPAWFLDRVVHGGRMSEPAGFAVLFGVGVLFGIAGFAILLRQPEPPMALPEGSGRPGLLAMIGLYRQPLGDPSFRKLLLFGGIFALAQFFAAPFYTVYALQELRLSYMWLQILGGVASLSSLLSMPLWGYLSDKFGNKPLLAIAVFGVSLTPLPWVIARADNLPMALVVLIANNLFGGFVWAGVGLLQFNMLIECTPSERRSVFVAVLSAVTGLAGGLAPVVGGLVVGLLHSTNVSVLGWSLGAYHIVFVLNALLRLVALFFLRGLPSAGRSTPRDVLGQLGAVRVGALLQMRRLQKGPTEDQRREAAESLSGSRLALAVDELCGALDDPSLPVRQSAADALGEIGDPAAVQPLIDKLAEPGSGITTEAARALGRIGSRAALSPLVARLQCGEAEERSAAAEALGRIGDPTVGTALVEALSRSVDAGETDIASAVALALGRLRFEGSLDLLASLKDHPHRALRLAAIRALGDIGGERAGSALMSVLASHPDPAVLTHVAAALARVGCREGALPLLQVLPQLSSATARRQVANAVGVLLGLDGLYRLLAGGQDERDLGVTRLLRSSTRPRAGGSAFGARRKAVLIDRAIELFATGEYGRSLEALWRAIGSGSAVPDDLVELWRVRAHSGDITVEEYLVWAALAARTAGGGGDSS